MALPTRYPIPAEQARVTTEVKGSRFLATGAYASSVEEANAFIAQIRKEFRDATHNCPAYRIGYGNDVAEWSSDDGEPSGTAGKPILSVLQGEDVGDVVVVVTRYFGGTKLGTGGLVRAYSGAARALLEALPIVMKVERTQMQVHVSYSAYEQIKACLEEYEVVFEKEDFAADVHLTYNIPIDQCQLCEDALVELSNGKCLPTPASQET